MKAHTSKSAVKLTKRCIEIFFTQTTHNFKEKIPVLKNLKQNFIKYFDRMARRKEKIFSLKWMCWCLCHEKKN